MPTEYRYPHFRRRLLTEDMSFTGGVAPGGRFPEFDLPTIDGGRVTTRDMVAGRPLFVYFASVT